MQELPYNKLTPGEAERLAMLTEEAGEVTLAACSILELLSSGRQVSPAKMAEMDLECLDFLAVTRMMHDDISAVYGQVSLDMQMFDGSSSLQEQVTILAAAASRVVQMACKTLRHGYASYHPKTPSRNNRALLALEIEVLVRGIHAFRSINQLKGLQDLDQIISKKMSYSHHQKFDH